MNRFLAVATAALVLLGNTRSHALVVRDAEGKPARGCGVEHLATWEPMAKGGRTAQRPTRQVDYRSPYGNRMFMFHYNTTGSQAISTADADTNGVPDWIDTAAWVADSVLEAYRQLGFHASLGDNGEGGGTQYDIYCSNLTNFYGWAHEPRDQGGYLEIDNDFAENCYEAKGYDALRVTLAHEMFHAVQFTYSPGAFPAWWEEMTATFMEDVMYDNVNDYYQYLQYDPVSFTDPIYRDPSVGLSYWGAVHQYSAAVFLKFLWERFGRDVAITAIRYTFERNASDVAPIVSILATTINMPMKDLLAEFWVWSYFTGDRARASQFFKEAQFYRPGPLDTVSYKTAADRATIRNLATIGTASGQVTAGFLGAQLLRIVPDGSPGGFRAYLDPHGKKWSWLVAVARPESVYVFEPSVINQGTGEQEITISGSFWQDAQDIVLVGANGETFGNSIPFSYRIAYDVTLDVAQSPALPSRTVLGQNAPNPFNPSTTIPISLERRTTVDLAIYDATGRVVRTLLRGGSLDAGEHRFTWDGATDAGQSAGAGVYIVELRTPSVRQARRMVLVR